MIETESWMQNTILFLTIIILWKVTYNKPEIKVITPETSAQIKQLQAVADGCLNKGGE